LNFKKGAIVGVILTLIYLILAFDIYATWSSVSTAGSNKTSVFLGVYIAISLVLTCFTIYVFPVLSRFDMTLKQLFKLVFYMSMKHILYTLGMLIVLAASVTLVLFNFMFLFIVPSAATLVSSMLMERLLKKYMPKSETGSGDSEEDRSIDKWYLE
jgi:uncharacterized membrane protein YesL